jgi:hypothetical protein
MGIKEYITDSVLRPRLEKDCIVVVYDPQRRYAEACLDLAGDGVALVDASESSLESRFQAMDELRGLGITQPATTAMVVYVPATKPETDEQKLADPFALYAVAGSVFPKDDGDSYQGICLKAKPGNESEIRRLFRENPNPSFAAVDAIGGGNKWPQLRAALSAESTKDILISMLCPKVAQAAALKQIEGWANEARDFLSSAVGLKLKTKGATLPPISDELWRYLLFSEFAFDLPEAMPASLTTVPQAKPEAELTIDAVCEQLRQNLQTRPVYIEKAIAVERELGLVEACRDIEDLGKKDTFPFEERTFLQRAINALLAGDNETANQLLERHKESVWLGQGESQQQWALVRASMNLINSCGQMMSELSKHTRDTVALLNFYVTELKETDRLQREFEQAVHNFIKLPELMEALVNYVRSRYRKLAEKTQDAFIRLIEESGYPAGDFIANGDAYEKFVARILADQGRKCGYIWVDALRYELGAELEKLLSEESTVELRPALAQLPTITIVGMASLLAQADTKLTLQLEGKTLTPKLDGQSVANVVQRMNIFRRLLNDRFEEMTLAEFIKPKKKIASTTDLLILRSTEIDSLLENDPAATLSNVPITLNQIRLAVHKMLSLDFEQVVIVSDHGFFLNLEPEAGDVCQKPQGTWTEIHHRFMLGSGAEDTHNFVMQADKLSVKGNFTQCAGPRTMAPYRSGEVYFHGGLSLQEAVVPILLVKPAKAKQVSGSSGHKVEIKYKNGATKITTQVPVIVLTLVAGDLFAGEQDVEVLIQATDDKGNVVGEPNAGGDLNPATGTVTLKLEEPTQITLRMNSEYEGKFTIAALNPVTGAGYGSLVLRTDYLN